jgi:hypothetical protein
MEYQAPAVVTPRRNTQVMQASLLLAALVVSFLPLLAALDIETDIPTDTRMWAVALWITSLYPLWQYLLRRADRRAPVPFMPAVGLLYGLYFALPVLLDPPSRHWVSITVDVTTDYAAPIQIALCGLLLLLLVRGAVMLGMRPAAAPDHEVTDAQLERRAWLLLTIGFAIDAARHALPIPPAVEAVLVFGATLSSLGVGILVVLAQRKQLSPLRRRYLYGAILLVGALQLTSGSAANLAFFSVTVLMSVWVALRTLPARWLLLASIVALVIISLRGVIKEYRKLTWYSGESISLVGRAQIATGLMSQSVKDLGVAGTIKKGAAAVTERSPSMELLTDVTRRTPSEIPHWHGRTYLTLVGAFIPRFLWPDKPSKTLGQDFAHRYSYIHYLDVNTSVNMPWLVEFYANFGWAGVIIGMTLTGALFGVMERVINRPRQSWLLSIVAVVLLVPLLNIESDFSLVFGGLFLNGLALAVVLRVIRSSSFPRSQFQDGESHAIAGDPGDWPRRRALHG